MVLCGALYRSCCQAILWRIVFRLNANVCFPSNVFCSSNSNFTEMKYLFDSNSVQARNEN